MSTLAHVFEAAGISTVVFGSMLDVVEKMAPPRALYCNFPLGRPMGHPAQPEYQTNVLRRGLALLDSTTPVIETYPDVIEADETAMSCQIPPRFDPNLPPAVDEAMGLRAAYDRALAKRGVTSVGRMIDADTVATALDVMHQWAEGASWKEVKLPGKNTVGVAHDIRSYYEEAALELTTAPPAGRAIEAWYYEETEAGKTVLAARQAMKDQDAPFGFWFYMAPGHR